MTASLIQRYQSGGDIYSALATQLGKAGADAVATAARSGDETQVNAALVTAKTGAPLNTSTVGIFLDQVTTDPLAAPLAAAERLANNTLLSFLKNPTVLILLIVVIGGAVFFWIGGFTWLRGSLAKKR